MQKIHIEMEDQYGMADLRQYMNGRASHFSGIPVPADFFSGHRNLTPLHHHYDMSSAVNVMAVGDHNHHHRHQQTTTNEVSAVNPPPHAGQMHHHHDFRGDSTTSASITGSLSLSGLEMAETCGLGAADGGTGRWPRQETLTLLEIRSRLDSRFKEAIQKGPLWDEVSRIMSEEHGFLRSGKKCREKFENLYKYYKKTREGKAGRQDGKHYRFFHQLEALYGEASNPSSASEAQFVSNSSFRYDCLPVSNNDEVMKANTNNNNQESCHQTPIIKLSDDSLMISLSNTSSSGFGSSSDAAAADDDEGDVDATNDDSRRKKKKRGKRSWKTKIRDFIDAQMRKLMEKQEIWLEKIMKTIEQKEEERMVREEEWRKEDANRIDRVHKFWANERAWMEARDSALMEALQKFTGGGGGKNELKNYSEALSLNNETADISDDLMKGESSWPECEITRLIQLRSAMEPRFQQKIGGGCSSEEEEVLLWEEIGAKMASLGYERSGLMCKNKWESISSYLMKLNVCNKKRKEDYYSSRNNFIGCYFHSDNDHHHQSGAISTQVGGGRGVGGSGPETLTTTATSLIAENNDHHAISANNANTMNESCYRFLAGGDSENLWENYGIKLSKGERH